MIPVKLETITIVLHISSTQISKEMINIMKTLCPAEHVRRKPDMYCPFYKYSHAIFEIALRYFTDSHIASCSSRLHIEYERNTVRFRDFRKAIPFEEMKLDSMESFRRWRNCGEFYGMSGWNPAVPMMLMGLCKEMELTSFCAGRKLTCRAVDDARGERRIRYGKESRTNEADGIEMKLTHEKDFDPAYIHALISQFHALFPDFEICVNGHELSKSNGLLDLLYMQLNPMRILEPIFSWTSNDLDLTAALQIYHKIEGGPFIFSFLNCHATFNGGDHNDAVRDALKNLELPFPMENLCIVFHCKVRTADACSKAIQSTIRSCDPDLLYVTMLKDRACFSSASARQEFRDNIKTVLQLGIYQSRQMKEFRNLKEQQ